MRRPPATECAICGKPYDQIGGMRVVWSHGAAVVRIQLKGTIHAFVNARAERATIVKLEGRFKELGLLLWGRNWTDEAIERARQQAQEGTIPWICTPCAGYACEYCGGPVYRTYGSHLEDHGKTSHVPAFLACSGCLNPSCENYQPLAASPKSIEEM